MAQGNGAEEEQMQTVELEMTWQFDQVGKSCLMKEESCPFYAGQTRSCQVTSGQGLLSEAKRQRCCSDDYDECPSYLAFLLRRSRPLRRDSDWLDAI